MIAAMVRNPDGNLLSYTCEYAISLCEEKAIERWGTHLWIMMTQELGYSIVNVEVKEI